ncbi:lipopolysaccharide biosynthesis protein [Deinococcus sp. SDU3-2]|uniref:Lipopolysaccharide biosynthesis protein n=1 Tax=Deinococcus terrestris TaxID=2651870 RepID=A0A7X1TTE9_9DEIO|nr:lipopolysaccharide biosynthesis protein [Deinococcus terrestris]MPY68381.1 lipopolysaccharide biosynthesis protein [Deinococcus terrestris]
MGWTFAASLVSNLAQFALISALAHWSSPRVVGQYAYALGVTGPIFLWLGLQLRNVMVTDVKDAFSFGTYATLRALSLAAALTLVAAVFWNRGEWWVIFALAVAKLFEGLSELIYAQLQRHGHLDWIAQGVLIRGLLNTALPLGLFALTRDLAVAAAGVTLVNLLTLLGYDLRRGRPFLPPIGLLRWPDLQQLVRMVWPLGVVAGLVSLSANIARIAVEHELGSEAQGIYSALSYGYIVGGVVIGAVGTALTTQFALRFAQGDRAGFLGLTARFMLLSLGVGLLSLLAGWSIGPWALRLLFGEEYAAHHALFLWLLGAGTAGYVASALGFAMTGARRFGEQLPLFAGVTLLLYALCELWIPRYGLMGAAYANLGAFTAQLVGSAAIIMKAMRVDFVPADQQSET